MQAYCGCDTTLLGEALRLPSELAGDGGSSGISVAANEGGAKAIKHEGV